MAVELRLLRREDAARCAELEQLLFLEENPWSEADFVAEMAQPHTFYVGVDVDGEVVAYGGLAMLGPADDPEFEVHTVGVDPRWQRRGFGRLVMDNFVHVADTAGGPIFLEVRTTNAPAIALYESLGFEHQGVRKNYYQPSGADAFVMVRPAGCGVELSEGEDA
ncbi:ribosomal protein S18-alanine N-acetyltransferase [Corynebacterium diphtheriae]|uniref:ribosomal protein S18-alanine N-acetyltransferase n=1 Tax=Corynebacterium diphtheriae TaxID=1717 RepID=UPI0002468ACB|nr:ribosomal protein S18-alanine N-acetyltransferase [Corynebacterium diphtheriae]MBG9292330.1 ribosomal protein S18-alanine N-acetyltransferase [Corynebacterium diphtheriae bv. gravis]AEX80471.1 putative ribosomal-protein-alanine acetyltransferase [Corynebacterium diphtheriae HC04]MBG9373140.1 ribosomal protein S18-alanine N-acetyltransferase [Corynebacterium diphtheriae bv. gravis]CAB0537908.1 ribosomal-protein-alanine N-acetyltransferase [Corynebacterium diphtheriae]CAB0683262.1 ribosomal-p